MTINDDKNQWFEDELGKTGVTQDLEDEWLKLQVTPFTGAIVDMWVVYLRDLGYTGTFPEMLKEWLDDGLGWT